MGFLIHRFGDTFAHTRLRAVNVADLSNYNLKEIKIEDGISDSESKILIKLAKEWKNISNGPINDKIPEWIQILNKQISVFGGLPEAQRQMIFRDWDYFNNRGDRVKLSQFLKNIYNTESTVNNTAGKLSLYGAPDGFTDQHASIDGSLPDYIFVRPEWYLQYVKTLSGLLKYKYNLPGKIDENIFKDMIKYTVDNKCSMRGVIDVEIAIHEGQNYVDVYKFLTSWRKHLLGFAVEAAGFTDLELQFKNDKERAERYLTTKKNKKITYKINASNYYRIIFTENIKSCPR